ncbi:polyphosphate kinase [Peptoclostridium litorale DSM 5388]|uniref:Polyphosphate kinase n=1 Tax=Peptoclostridium litorale DSM 5388 TaxID=1121324 RepID=A0A069RLP7_PEPLI|nr:RNA degradosome polyphosphate kinase [Peptoclostridium litorale]KDR95097.1 polyphosphate kinase Ppk [Peptoclostridium litorale DSM 5388]SIN75056.1 polyphosphate kinase [Peptoclostridium litorale DSM 5388]
MKDDNYSRYISRELSWLEFNKRVLQEAQDRKNPLIERIKFLSITSSNLDEFFMVRVASIWDQVNVGFKKPDIAGLTPMEQINKISAKVKKLLHAQQNCLLRSVVPTLKKNSIEFLEYEYLSQQERMFIERYYRETIYPVLTPMVVDQSRPFPLLLNKSLNMAVLLEDEKKGSLFGTVQVPSVLPRCIELPDGECKRYIMLEEVIKNHMQYLFEGHNIIHMGCYRITRNGDLSVDEEGAEDLLEAIEESLKQRKWGHVVRLEYEKGLSPVLMDRLKEEMEIPQEGIFEINGPIDLTFMMKFSSQLGREDLEFPPFKPQSLKIFSEYDDIFEVISKKDVLLNHPFESFQPVVELVQKAADDPNVLAIKQTLYRVSGNSPIIHALARAAENGKQVTVLLEIKARFDEENNINWAKKLEQSGCHVIYGLVGLKTHCKLLIVVRREEDGIKRYVHMGTGNYNDVTARFYTDMGMLTANPYFGEDASTLFNMLSGSSQNPDFYKVEVAPGMDRAFLKLINQESENAKEGKEARIIAKMNSLVDKRIIDGLYEASQAGVKIDLIVRGICCLRPGVKCLSENIRVISIVGRFLEHTRAFYFYNDGDERIYLSSADWMPRNLNRRVELLFPIESHENRQKVKQMLSISLGDTLKARIMKSDGTYKKVDRRGKGALSSQEKLYEIAMEENEIPQVLDMKSGLTPILKY